LLPESRPAPPVLDYFSVMVIGQLRGWPGSCWEGTGWKLSGKKLYISIC